MTLLLEALPLGDDRIVVDVTPNRPDLLGHKGIARELAASLNVPYRLPQLGPNPLAPDVPPVQRAASVRETVTGPLRVAIDDPEGCARFHAAVVRGVKVGPSPVWLRQPLEAVGVRSINNIVDATNYVMLELGQPMHAYDLATLKGPALVARRARAGEKLVTLDGAERTLDGETTVIADAARVVGIGGIMGGHDTEVRDGTSDLALEAAWFSPPASVARAGRSASAPRRAIGSNAAWTGGMPPKRCGAAWRSSCLPRAARSRAARWTCTRSWPIHPASSSAWPG